MAAYIYTALLEAINLFYFPLFLYPDNNYHVLGGPIPQHDDNVSYGFKKYSGIDSIKILKNILYILCIYHNLYEIYKLYVFMYIDA